MSLQVSIISPERRLYEGEAQSVILPGVLGSFMVLKNHAPLVSELVAGQVVVQLPQETSQIYLVESGFAEVRNNKVIALVEGAVLPEEVDKAKVQQELEEWLKKTVVGDEALMARQRAIAFLRVKLRGAVS